MFLGALVSGLIGALALNLIDRLISNKLKNENDKQQFDKKNEIIQTQEKILNVVDVQLYNQKVQVATNIAQRHFEAGEHFDEVKQIIQQNSEDSEKLHNSTTKTNADITNLLDSL